MKIRYTGKATVRIVGDYRWDRGNNYLQDVDGEGLIEDLLTNPANDFEKVEEAPKKSAGKKSKDVHGGER